MGRQIRATVDAAARAGGLDRRRFLPTAGGVAASLAVFDLAAVATKGKGPTTRRQMLGWLASPLTRWTPL